MWLPWAAVLLGCAGEAATPAGEDAEGGVDTAAPVEVDAAAPPDAAPEDVRLPSADLPSDVPPFDDTDVACECPVNFHCDATGQCAPDVCVPGLITCADTKSRSLCNADGTAEQLEPCPEGQVCELGVCSTPVCTPGGAPVCDGLARQACNALGTGFVPLPCPGTTVCVEGDCAPLQPNVLLLVDTSGSMNDIVATGQPANECITSDCPPWQYPDCDYPDAPETRIGFVKKALRTLLDHPDAAKARIGLVRFPQVEAHYGDCDSGYYYGLDLMTGDDDGHQAGSWFDQHQGEVIAAPLSTGAEQSVVRAWVDGSESLTSVGQTCVEDDECASTICFLGKCATHKGHELRGDGSTPLGKTLFYASEYLRKFVLVEGKPCGDTAACGSPHYACINGTCHDAAWACRPNVLIVLTDGAETENTIPTSFFHPRVQAKRLRYGLGCSDEAGCGPDATCEAGVCRPPDSAVPWTTKVCAIQDRTCDAANPCPEYPCSIGDTCEDPCVDGAIQVTEFGPPNRLTTYAGKPVSATVHVLDASGAAGAESFLAAWGGGESFPVDFADLGGFVGTLLGLLQATDVKTEACE